MFATFLILCVGAALVCRSLGGFATYYRGPVSDHFDGTRFYNPGMNSDKSRADLLKWKRTSKPAQWPLSVPNAPQTKPQARVMGKDLAVTFIGHSTFLIQTGGLNILTDPLFSERASPLTFIGPKRVRPPAVALEDLPKIDYILVSHNHYDHLDRRTIRRIVARDKSTVVTPLGNDAIIGLPGIVTLDWTQSVDIAPGMRVTLEQAYHWSARGLYDRRKALWGAFVIEAPGGPIYFAGDTGYGDGRIFRDAYAKYGRMRLALLPIGAYEPRWFMRSAHMSPEDAVQAWRDMGEPPALGMHFGTLQLTDEAIDAPEHELQRDGMQNTIQVPIFGAVRQIQPIDEP